MKIRPAAEKSRRETRGPDYREVTGPSHFIWSLT